MDMIWYRKNIIEIPGIWPEMKRRCPVTRYGEAGNVRSMKRRGSGTGSHPDPVTSRRPAGRVPFTESSFHPPCQEEEFIADGPLLPGLLEDDDRVLVGDLGDIPMVADDLPLLHILEGP